MGALDGLKVVEAGLLVQGPQAAATLAEWGADVIKIELPGVGDQSRWLPVQPGDPRSAYFIGCNRGKRSVTADLRTPDGREVFLRLAEWADVVITNFAPGTMDQWQLGYDAVAARNPRIVYAAGSTFGTEGANARREGADLSGQAAGGLISTTGRAGQEVTPIGATIADHTAAQNLVGGILAALYARERTGVGQRVATSLLGGQIWAQASEYTGCFLRGAPAGRANRGHPLIPGLYGIFRTADGWIAVVGVVGALRTTFFEVVGRPEYSERFAQPLYWDDEKNALWPLLDDAFAADTTAGWCARLKEAGLRHAPVRNHAEVIADPDTWANGYFVNVDGIDAVAAPVDFSATPARTSVVAPELGQHTEEVLIEIGYSWDDIARLQDARAI
ncbi:MAG TPA: CoA transferase [Acidimicrobiales bacterium]|jgi:crotonobetainyl-CoA:carnitine CoA-transferase CaiB-like acyl-CoA transferase|nr:CoA transferase [Acidimicrobiales bacterium]